jgi:hypothetical protein
MGWGLEYFYLVINLLSIISMPNWHFFTRQFGVSRSAKLALLLIPPSF